MFCGPGPVLDGTEGVRSCFHVLRSRTCFHVLRSRTHFRRYRGHRVPFSTVLRASGPVFLFSVPGPVFGGSEGVGTHFWRYRRRRFPFSCFVLPYPFLAVPTASCLVFIFCATRPIFGGTDGVGSRFYVLLSRIRFRRYRRRLVPFSCFALPDSFSAVPRVWCPVLMFCAPGPIFGGTDGFWSRFHVLRYQTNFRRYRGRRVPFSCFALPHPFLAVPTASGLVFILCAPGRVFGSTVGVGSHFHVLRSRTRFRRYRRCLVLFFMFCAPGHIFSGTECLVSRCHVLCSRTRFRRYRWRRDVLRSRSLFLRYRGRRVPYSRFALPIPFSAVPRRRVLHSCFGRYRGHRVPFSCFAPKTTTSGLVFIFCAPGHVFNSTDVVGSSFYVLRSRACFR
jgi:hypothetical protein